MRVIAGRLRSRKLKPVPGYNTRPTPDRLREALFNVLTPRIEGTVFLDAYAGTGAVGIEALSRGAKHAIFIERKADALAILRENLCTLDLENNSTAVRGSAAMLIPKYDCDLAFLDPPYEDLTEYGASLGALSRTRCELAIAQHATRVTLEAAYGEFVRVRVLRQGDNSLSFYQRQA